MKPAKALEDCWCWGLYNEQGRCVYVENTRRECIRRFREEMTGNAETWAQCKRRYGLRVVKVDVVPQVRQ